MFMFLTVTFIRSLNCCLKDRTYFSNCFFLMNHVFKVNKGKYQFPMYQCFFVNSTENKAL